MMLRIRFNRNDGEGTLFNVQVPVPTESDPVMTEGKSQMSITGSFHRLPPLKELTQMCPSGYTWMSLHVNIKLLPVRTISH